MQGKLLRRSSQCKRWGSNLEASEFRGDAWQRLIDTRCLTSIHFLLFVCLIHRTWIHSRWHYVLMKRMYFAVSLKSRSGQWNVSRVIGGLLSQIFSKVIWSGRRHILLPPTFLLLNWNEDAMTKLQQPYWAMRWTWEWKPRTKFSGVEREMEPKLLVPLKNHTGPMLPTASLIWARKASLLYCCCCCC